MQNEKFNHRIIIGFVYHRIDGHWQLGELIGEQVATELGIHYILRESPEGDYPHQIHYTKLLNALINHSQRLGGGAVSIDASDDHYRVEIRVKPRQNRPQHQEQAWRKT